MNQKSTITITYAKDEYGSSIDMNLEGHITMLEAVAILDMMKQQAMKEAQINTEEPNEVS